MMKQILLLIPLLFGLISCETVEENPQVGAFHGMWAGDGELQTSLKAGLHNCSYVSYRLEHSLDKFVLGKRVFQCDGGWTRSFPAVAFQVRTGFLYYNNVFASERRFSWDLRRPQAHRRGSVADPGRTCLWPGCVRSG